MPDLATRLDLDAGAVVDLFEIQTDANAILFRFSPGPRADGTAILFGGERYDPVPIAVSGLGFGGGARSSGGSPRLTLGRLDPVITGDPRGDDWLGYRLRWRQTLARHLDGAADADSAAYHEEMLWIGRERSRTRAEVEFELTTPLELVHLHLPRRQVLREYCPWRYRLWTGASWDYAKAQCPYRGAARFDVSDNPTSDSSQDNCSGTPAGCRLRFPDPAALPFGGFLGVGGAARPR